MMFGRCILLAALAALVPGEAAALVAPATLRAGLEAADGARLRVQRTVAWNQAPRPAAARSQAALARRIGAVDTIWDAATGVPLRVWGAGAAAPGSVASPEAAARAAGELLRAHLDALAPGSAPEDFVLVGNDLHDGVRSVGFRQHHRGRPVLGGQVSFRFKRDRLIAVGSEALPRVQVEIAAAPVPGEVARARAVAWIGEGAAGGAVDGPFVLPLVGDTRVLGYREVLRVRVDVPRGPARWDVYVDAATGAPVARVQTLMFASGSVKFDAPVRGPQGTRQEFAATRLSALVNGAEAVSDATGELEIPDGMESTVTLGVEGPLVGVQNEGGPEATADFLVKPGGTALWSAAADEQLDAQLSAFIHAGVVKDRMRQIAPDFAYLDQQLPVVVNIASTCNAFSTGDSINFFSAGDGCENTARIADIVYHEYGHSVHSQGLIPGVGAFEGALSEGISDYLSTTITGDASLAPGFFIDAADAPLRELDPEGKEYHWPEDLSGEPHNDGQIIAATLWDLRTALRAKLGEAEGIAHTDKIFFESIRRAVDIPTMYPEALVVDDDDGDLANGTPNECEINQAFHLHGLLLAGSVRGEVSLGATGPEGTPVDLAFTSAAKPCVDLEPTASRLRWRVSGSDEQGELAMAPTESGWTALLPPQPDGTRVEYQVEVQFSDETTMQFPVNAGDPWYQLWIGPVTELYCTGFEGSDGVKGWGGDGEWEQGAPTGQGGDPEGAFAGAALLGNNLAGTYQPESDSYVVSPAVDTQGFDQVRLQYRRWLNVEDNHFDQATILANKQVAWENFDSEMGDSSSVHHRDREWRFHDVDLTPFVADEQVQLHFTLKTDGGLELGGWNVDELCVVGVGGAASALCGDGVVSGAEQCDDGNTTPGDGCDASCQTEGPGGESDAPTTSDGGDASSGEGSGEGSSGESTGGIDDDGGCGCRSAGAGGAPLALLLLAGRRRRRR
jgi:MYXO-CTERM domain-containing protein